MGDRALFQVYSSKSGDFGPVVYTHWQGFRAKDIVENLSVIMGERTDDVQYASARLVTVVAEFAGPGPLGLGMWNTDKLLTSADSHGDGGCILIDCSDGFRCKCEGGYYGTGPDGMPVRVARGG